MRAREKRRERERRGVRSRDGGRSRRFLCRGFVCLPRRASSMFLTAHNHQKYHHHIFDDSNLKSNRRVAAMSKVHFRQPLVQKSVVKVAFGFDRLPHHFFRSDKDESKATERGLHLQRRRRRCYHHRDPARKGMKISFKKRLWK